MKSLLHRLIRLDHLISHKSTGTPADCAQKVGISERSLYDYLKLLKEMGAPVKSSAWLSIQQRGASGRLRARRRGRISKRSLSVDRVGL